MEYTLEDIQKMWREKSESVRQICVAHSIDCDGTTEDISILIYDIPSGISFYGIRLEGKIGSLQGFDLFDYNFRQIVSVVGPSEEKIITELYAHLAEHIDRARKQLRDL